MKREEKVFNENHPAIFGVVRQSLLRNEQRDRCQSQWAKARSLGYKDWINV